MMVMRYKVGEGVRGPQSTGGGQKVVRGGQIGQNWSKLPKKWYFPRI